MTLTKEKKRFNGVFYFFYKNLFAEHMFLFFI